MKKVAKAKRDRDLLPEYDFSRGSRGRWARRCREGSNVVLLDPDVAGVFPDARSVNQALRALMDIARRKRPRATAHG
jgi:hypothetical protein